MKTEVLCLWIFVACVLEVTKGEIESYEPLNLDEILIDNDLLNSYYECVMEVGECTPESTRLKEYLYDILQTNCEKCTPTQKDKFRETADFFKQNEPELWEGLVNKYDPTNELMNNILLDMEFV